MNLSGESRLFFISTWIGNHFEELMDGSPMRTTNDNQFVDDSDDAYSKLTVTDIKKILNIVFTHKQLCRH